MKTKGMVIFLGLICPAVLSFADEKPAPLTFQQVQQLQQAGKDDEAFLAYLTIPGAEYTAVAIARPKAEAFLKLLKSHRANLPGSAAKLVEGDLLLATGHTKDALACYRNVAEASAASDGYFVEPPAATHPGYQPTAPFTVGAGSHRDNWILRRFIALEAWADAGKEFERLWILNRRNVEPYILSVPKYVGQKIIGSDKYLVRPTGYNGRSLQFALDYSFFLKKRGDSDKAFAVLTEPLLRMDMDKNPSGWSQSPRELATTEMIAKYPERANPVFSRWFDMASSGTSRKEFIRLVYGEFATAQKVDNLIKALQDQITGGNNRARRVLARIRLHQGKPGESSALELDYIKNADFGPMTSAYRRGLIHEELQEPALASAEYEKLLVLPDDATVSLPDADEESSQTAMMSQRAIIPGMFPAQGAGPQLRTDVMNRLIRIYGGMGDTGKVLGTSLRQFDTSPQGLNNLHLLEPVAARFTNAGKEQAFRDWAAKKEREAALPLARANLNWVLGRHDETIKFLAESAKKDGGRDGLALSMQEWKGRFRKLGLDKLKAFLRAIVAARPDDAGSALEFLDLEDQADDNVYITALEGLLASDASAAFQHYKGDYNRTKFRSYFDLAYRLMRLYERGSQIEKLRATAMRIARGERPFGEWWKINDEQHRYRDSNDLPDDLNACLALAVQNADAPMLEALKTTWTPLPDFPAKHQLERRLAGGFKPPENLKPFGWANVTGDVHLIASMEDVVSLTRDDKYVYAGHPWGLSIHDFKGEPVTRIALAVPANAIAAQEGQIWVGTKKGLFRITRDKWDVAHIWLHGDVPEKDRYGRSSPAPESYYYENAVTSLALDGHSLWIGLNRNVQLLDTKSRGLRAYSSGELKISNRSDYNRIFPEKDYVWASSRDSGIRRFNRKTGAWDAVSYGKRQVELIGDIGGQLLGRTWVDDKLRCRPCVIDRDNLHVTPILIDDNRPGNDHSHNSMSYYGMAGGGHLFGAGYPGYVLDEKTMTLRPLQPDQLSTPEPVDTMVPAGLRSGDFFVRQRTDVECIGNDQTHHHTVFDMPFQAERWRLLTLPDGTRVLGGKHESTEAHGRHTRETSDYSGGLIFIARDGKTTRVSAKPYSDAMPGSTVYDALQTPDGKQTWLCTDRGVAVLDPGHRIIATYSRKDGLCANRVTGGAVLGQKLYFATGWGDCAGGLAVYDPATSVFTAFFQSDGLASDKLARIEPSGSGLRLIYDVVYGRMKEGRWMIYAEDDFSPEHPARRSNVTPTFFDDNGLSAAMKTLYKLPGRVLPCLAGQVMTEVLAGGDRLTCGEHGLVVSTGNASPNPEISELAVTLITDPGDALKVEARKMQHIELNNASDLAQYLKSANPYIRANAVALLLRDAALRDEFIPVLTGCMNDPVAIVRSTVLFIMTRPKVVSSEVMPALNAALNDQDAYIRAFATQELCRRGKVPEAKRLREIMNAAESFGNLPFGAESTIGVVVSKEFFLAALAPHASTKEHFALLLDYPVTDDSYEPRQAILTAFGKSLAQHPEAVGVLLTAKGNARQSPSPARCAQLLFKYAGKEILPMLNKALQSKDRVVRSNAARGCGALCDQSSIRPLLDALDLESGLSRASIVWALGELKAREALPQLTTLYVDVRNDEKRRMGGGFRASQSAAVMEGQYDSIRNVDVIGSDWNELKEAALQKPADPRTDEDLLSTEGILDAIGKIGPDASQEFYRMLASEKHPEARREAAARLGECRDADKARNVPILRNLLADDGHATAMNAAGSLLRIGEEDPASRYILRWLKGNSWEKRGALEQLRRLRDAKKISFARKEIEAIANSHEHEPDSDLLRRYAGDLLKAKP